jgi:hypothetical protein
MALSNSGLTSFRLRVKAKLIDGSAFAGNGGVRISTNRTHPRFLIHSLSLLEKRESELVGYFGISEAVEDADRLASVGSILRDLESFGRTHSAAGTTPSSRRDCPITGFPVRHDFTAQAQTQ